MATSYKNINQFYSNASAQYADSEIVASGDNLVYSIPSGRTQTRAIMACSGGSTGNISYTLDIVTDATSADAATWVADQTLTANQTKVASLESPIMAVKFTVATAGSATCEILTERLDR